ncbi:MAG: hypothetical protein RIQ72_274 [Candidatus Parcubacteria bacterium]
MNYKKAVLIVILATVFFALLVGVLYYFAIQNSSVISEVSDTQGGVSTYTEYTDVQNQNPKGDAEVDSEIEEEKVSVKEIEDIENGVIATTTSVQTGGLIYAPGLTSLSSSTYIVAFVGDIGINSDSRKVLSLVKQEASASVILGDFDYADRPDLWSKMLDEQLGRTFPLIMLIGNHDEKKWSEYLADIKSRLARTPAVNCRGDIAVKSVCAYKDMRVVITAPGISSLQASSSVYADYIETEGAKLDAKTWNLCAWHKNQRRMQVGTKADEAGWETYEACDALGFPIMTAHEHSYSRSFLFSDVKKQELTRHESIALNANAGLKEAKTIDHLKLAAGKTFVMVSGLGGKSIRPQTRNDAWWSSIYTSTQGAKPGALFCAFNYKGDTKRALCYFKNIDGEVKDVFLMER